MLGDAGYRLAGAKAFPDHHHYTAKDVARIEREARAAGAAVVVTTEKDAVRFQAVDALPFQLRVVPMTLDIDQWDALTAGIEQAIVRAREAT
jgi:tetraacyldisaccharide 4'-kinase